MKNSIRSAFVAFAAVATMSSNVLAGSSDSWQFFSFKNGQHKFSNLRSCKSSLKHLDNHERNGNASADFLCKRSDSNRYYLHLDLGVSGKLKAGDRVTFKGKDYMEKFVCDELVSDIGNLQMISGKKRAVSVRGACKAKWYGIGGYSIDIEVQVLKSKKK